jgi:hypothetical protein
MELGKTLVPASDEDSEGLNKTVPPKGACSFGKIIVPISEMEISSRGAFGNDTLAEVPPSD